MKCAFTIEHYREILKAALEAGYVFRGFHQRPPVSGWRVLYLRHDLDVCLEEALDMAKLEAELGVHATYFILINSPVYNPLAKDSLEIVEKIRSGGHWIGLHVDPVLLPSDDASAAQEKILQLFEFYRSQIPLVPVVSFHRPNPMVMGCDFSAFVSTYSPPFFTEIKYLSDSRGTWREGCPCRALREGAYKAMQILVHPIWWKTSEHESLEHKVSALLGQRIQCLRSYLASNVTPLADILNKEGKL